jgi:hypothetical protein
MSSKENFIGTNPFSLHCHIYFIQNLDTNHLLLLMEMLLEIHKIELILETKFYSNIE